jgi:hypothetical protein
VPISGFVGDNQIDKSSNLSGDSGGSLLETLDTLMPHRIDIPEDRSSSNPPLREKSTMLSSQSSIVHQIRQTVQSLPIHTLHGWTPNEPRRARPGANRVTRAPAGQRATGPPAGPPLDARARPPAPGGVRATGHPASRRFIPIGSPPRALPRWPRYTRCSP